MVPALLWFSPRTWNQMSETAHRAMRPAPLQARRGADMSGRAVSDIWFQVRRRTASPQIDIACAPAAGPAYTPMRSPVLTGLLLAAAALPAAALQQPIPLDTVHVSAGSRLVAGAPALTRSVDVLDRRAIDALPARTITDVIARALGVDLLARSPAQADLSVRGSGFEQVLVLVDRVPV